MQKEDNKRPTLKTIAELTGLSLSTVSLSLRDGSNLKQTTRDKVARAAAQIGYVPNRAGVRLRTGRTNVLALLLSSETNALDFTRQLIQGIGTRIDSTRYHLTVIPEIGNDNKNEPVQYVLENQTADGVILTHTSARDPRVQLLQDANFPFVSHGQTEFYTPHAFHDFNAKHFVDLAVERLASKGRQRLLLAVVDSGTTHYAILVNSFKQATAQFEIVGKVVRQPGALHSTLGARAFAKKLTEETETFDGVICENELVALAIINGLQDGGYHQGCEYDLICKQTTEILPLLYPDMDTIAEDLFASGSELANLLLQCIDGESVDSLATMHEPIVHWRSNLVP